MKPARAKRLADIAKAAGYRVADLWTLTEHDRSTFWVHATETDWPVHVDAKTLLDLMAAVPGIAEEVRVYAQAARLVELDRELRACDVEINQEALQHNICEEKID